jgi:hypothetical protein
MATLLKVLNNLADIKSAGGVALRVRTQGDAIVRIAINVEAFDAITSTLPLGSVGYENKVNEKGERLIWLDHAVVARLRATRGSDESYSDVILRLVEAETPPLSPDERALR